ncbi:MAG: O-methyltransferase [Planctomycetota bacterium]|jgi:predicted O-methyltransferase YrrM
MARVYEADDFRRYAMDFKRPFEPLEPLEREVEVVDGALAVLVEAGVLPHSRYDTEKLLVFRAAVREKFEIPWTAISPRVQRLLYAINAIARPRVMVAVGVFCGNTFISNAGAAVGPGACYEADRLVGLEIRPREADRARRNVATIDPERRAEIIAADGIPWLAEFDGTIDLLYLDADGGETHKGKSIYLDLVRAAEHALRPGSIVLAHNSVNSARDLADYLEHVRDGDSFRESVNVVVDNQGVEVSVR